MTIKRILCFAPHPDDEILGCGGSIIKAIDRECTVHICYLSYGEQGSPKFIPRQLKYIRKKEALNVCNFLGINKKNITFLSIPDNEISMHDIKSMKKIMELVRKIKPDLVYLPHERDNYYDHEQANKLIMRALDMSGSNNFIKFGGSPWWVENVLAYEVRSPLEKYQYTEDISDVINKKIAALKLYRSQSASAGNVSDFVSEKGKFLSGYRAAMTVGDYREAFQVLRIGNIFTNEANQKTHK